MIVMFLVTLASGIISGYFLLRGLVKWKSNEIRSSDTLRWVVYCKACNSLRFVFTQDQPRLCDRYECRSDQIESRIAGAITLPEVPTQEIIFEYKKRMDRIDRRCSEVFGSRSGAY